MAVTMALWNPDPDGWYCDQEASGGMPLTHMSYCYLNAVRWILGRPATVSAMANRMRNTAPGRVVEETCGALIGFENGAFASATASYIGPEGMPDPQPRFICAEGGIQPNPESPPGKDSITVFRGGGSEVRTFANEPSPQVRQAAAFLDAIESRREARNPPEDALIDVEIAEAVSISARERRTVSLEEMRQVCTPGAQGRCTPIRVETSERPPGQSRARRTQTNHPSSSDTLPTRLHGSRTA